MPFRIPLRKKRAVNFRQMATENPPNHSNNDSEVEELSDPETMSVQPPQNVPIPPLFANQPLIRDALVTESTEMQDATLEELLPYLTEPEGDLNVFGISQLIRNKHVKYLKMMLEGPYPKSYVAADATRPWMLYWALAALSVLEVDLTEYRERYVFSQDIHVSKLGTN
jgi:protein farnesyltransferase subunit beta